MSRRRKAPIQWMFLVGGYMASLVWAYLADETTFFYLELAFIPLGLLGWGLSLLLAGREMRTIARHLTTHEREALAAKGRAYGAKVGIFWAVPFSVAFGVTYEMSGGRFSLVYVALGVTSLLVGVPLGLRVRRDMRRFMLSTRYGRQRGADR